MKSRKPRCWAESFWTHSKCVILFSNQNNCCLWPSELWATRKCLWGSSGWYPVSNHSLYQILQRQRIQETLYWNHLLAEEISSQHQTVCHWFIPSNRKVYMPLWKKKSTEWKSDVSLFIKPSRFLFEMYLIFLKYCNSPSTVFSGDCCSAELIVCFFPSLFFMQIAWQMWRCSGAAALQQPFCGWWCLLLQNLLLAGVFNPPFRIVEPRVSYCWDGIVLLLLDRFSQASCVSRDTEQIEDVTWVVKRKQIYCCLYLSDCWHCTGCLIFVFWDWVISNCSRECNLG